MGKLRADLQLDVIARMKSTDPKVWVENLNFGNHMHYNIAFANLERRAEFTEMMWPVFAAHSSRSRSGLPYRERWEKTLEEIFTAVGRPERAKALTALLDFKAPPETFFPEDLRFMVQRPDILPPELARTPLVIAPSDTLYLIDALHFDGESLWVGAQSGRASSTTNVRWGQRMVNTGAANKLYRLQPGSAALDEEIDPKLPSKICALGSDDKSLWAGTQQNGIFQLERKSGALIRHWDIATGLPTRNIYALEIQKKSVIAGGGDQHRGHLFELTNGVDGVVNRSLPGWREDKAQWRKEEIPQSQFGEVSILLRAHGRTLAVASGAQAVLWKGKGQGAVNLLDPVLSGDSRWGKSGQNGTVIAATHDAQGWWFGTDAGLVRLSPDGTVLRRWMTPIGGDSFEQTGLVPSMRSSGVLRRNFEMKTRLVGAVTALAADGDFLFAAVSTEVDDFLPSPLEGAHLYILHIPSGKWLGRVKLPARATAIAQDPSRLWLGCGSPTAGLLQFNKSDLTNVPAGSYVDDSPSAAELESAVAKLTIIGQASYAFFRNDPQRVVELLSNLTPETASLGELFLIAYSNDKKGLKKPDVARAFFQEILRRQPHSFWQAEAEYGIKALK